MSRVVEWLASDVDLGVRRCVLAGVGDELLDLVVGGSRVGENADLHPDRGGLAVFGDLLVEHLPGLRVAVGPRLNHEAAGTVRAPHALPADGDVALGDVFAHGTANEAHRVSWFRGHCCGRGGEEVEDVEMHDEKGLTIVTGLSGLEMSVEERCSCCRTQRTYI